MRANSLIQVLPQSISADPLKWEFTLTQKGTQRAKNLAKSVGLIIKLEIDLDESNKCSDLKRAMNKITINMYDKDLMPIVDDLYLNDQTNGLLTMKQEGK